MIDGSCCCGTVKFSLSAEPAMVGTCHCTRCRKVGASTMAFVRKQDIHWIQGRENIQVFKPSEPYLYERCFCKTCGSSLGEILSDADSFPIAANALDGDVVLKNQFHEFVSEKPCWYDLCDDAKQYDGHPEPTE